MIAVEEVYDMRKGRRADVVEKPCNCLFCVVREVPYDESHSDAVFKACVPSAHIIPVKGDVFAPTVHSHLLQAPHGRGFRQTGNEIRHLRCVNLP